MIGNFRLEPRWTGITSIPTVGYGHKASVQIIDRSTSLGYYSRVVCLLVVRVHLLLTLTVSLTVT